MKPGQISLERQLYSQEVKPITESYIDVDKPHKSVYARTNAQLEDPQHYTNPVKPLKPIAPKEDNCGHRGTEHWRSEYKSTFNDLAVAGAVYHRQDGPSYQAANPPSCVSAGPLTSSYHEEYGVHGSDPRHKMPAGQETMPVFRTSLTTGTCKGTLHIPGYQGFLAKNTSNPYVARVERGETLRPVVKISLTDQYHPNKLGYTGHQPLHCSNARGAVQPTNRTTAGRDFQMHSLAAFATD